MVIESLTAAQDSEVESFLDALALESASVLAYHYPFYRRVLESVGVGEPTYFGARRGGELVGVLPCFRKRASAGTVYCSLPFFGPNAGVLCRPAEKESVEPALLNALLEHARADGALACSVYTPFLGDDLRHYDRVFAGAAVVEKSTLYLPLGRPDRGEFIAYAPTLARNLRKAERSDITVTGEVTDSRISDLYAIYRQNCADYGIPAKSRAVLDALAAQRGRWVHFYFALQSGELMIAALVVLHSPRTASYYLPCSTDAARTLQPTTLLIDRAMRHARAEGLDFWNWEASPSRDSGVYRFKKKWGSLESSYRVYSQILGDPERLCRLGADGIASEFPYFFVYPFDRLRPESRCTAANA